MFKDWSWQKWVSRIFVVVLALGGIAFKFVAPEINPDWQPSWWIPIISVVTLIVNGILALFPAKQT